MMLVNQAFDGAAISEISLDTANSVEQKLMAATSCFEKRANWLPAYTRIEVLRRLAQLMRRDFEDFAMLIAREGGKPLSDARVETTRAINGVESAASSIEHLAGRQIPMGLTSSSMGRWAFTTKEPIGVVAAISAFNHPLNLIVHQVAPAIATGCPVIVKPAIRTPLSCLRFVALVHEAGLPPSWCQTLIVDHVGLAEVLATDPAIAFLSFIGSATVGWYLRSKLPAGTRCALEHGGAAPVIVDRSADLDSIIEPLVKGGYYHAGQVCVSVQRIYAHADVMQSLIEKLTERVASLRVGDPTLPDTEVGPMIHPTEVDRVALWIDEAVSSGGITTTGGMRINNRIYAPTVIVEPSETARVSREEIFGPATCIYQYSNIDEAVSRANSLPTAFQASVFAKDIDVALNAARSLDASAVMINDHTAFRTDWMPFAGRRQSGYGVGGIPCTMMEMMQDKMIVLKG